MALRIQLRGTRPGYGRLALLGWDASTENLEIAIQRNSDGGHLAQNQQWQSTEYWHGLEIVEDDQGRLSAELGPDIIDAMIAASGVQFKLFVRSADAAGSSVVQTIGRLLGSEAGNGSSDIEKSPIAAVDVSQNRPSEEGEAMEQTGDFSANQHTEDLDQADGQPLKTVEKNSGARRLLAVVLSLLLLAGAAWGLWFFLRQPDQHEAPVSKKQKPDTSVVATIEGGVAQASRAEGAGNPRVLRFLRSSPTPTLIYARAAGWEQEGDCDAAMITYRIAAEAEAESAFKFAQRYDPDRFARGGCIAKANSDAAAYWYEKPASSGNPEAQRRLGELLIEKHASGPLYHTARNWLQKAADQGDRRAEAILDAKQK